MNNSMGLPDNRLQPGMASSNASISVGDINVGGDVEGSIIVGNNNQVYDVSVNIQHGDVINLQVEPTVKRHSLNPKPPRAPRGFVGRGPELEALGKNITSREAIFIYGHDGLGKTSLIRQVANSNPAQNMPDGVIFLESVDEAGKAFGFQDIVQSLFDSLYTSYPPLKVNSATARTYLSHTAPLVILDGFDLPIGAYNDLPDLFPGGALLVSSRSPSAEDEFQPYQLSPLKRRDSIQLLSEKSGIPTEIMNLATMDRICELCNDVPLALTKLANMIQRRRLTLEDAGRKLEGIQTPSREPIQAGIERSFGVVYSLLNSDERAILSRVAAAPGISVERYWLESTTEISSVAELEALEIIQANSPRMRISDAFRRFINPNPAELRQQRQTLLARILRVLDKPSLDFSYITEELGNILGLIEWASSENRWKDVIALGKIVDPYLTLHGLWDAWESVLKRILQAGQKLDDQAVQAWALHQLGSREIGAGSIPQAIKYLVHALRIRESAGDKIGAAFTRHNLNIILPPPGNKQDAKPDKPRDGGGPNSIQRWWYRLRALVRENPGRYVPILVGIPIVIAVAWFIINYLLNSRLGLSIEALPAYYLDPSKNTIQYTYGITNKSTAPIEGSFLVTSNLAELVECPGPSTTGNLDGLLDPGETLICNSLYHITPADVKRGSVTNRAQAHVNRQMKSNYVSLTTKLEQSLPSLSLTMDSDTDVYRKPGEIITYNYAINNTGNVSLHKPAEIKDITASVNCDAGNSPEGGTAYLRPHETMTCTSRYSITPDDLERKSLTNKAIAVIEGIASNEVSKSIEADIIPEMSLTITADLEKYEREGQTITYSYIVTNTGNLTINSSPVIFDEASTEICKVSSVEGNPALLSKATASCTSIYTVTQADLDIGSVTKKATVKAEGVPPVEGFLTLYADQKPALTLVKTANPGTYSNVGDAITYTYVITNSGNVTLESYQIGVSDNKIEGGNRFGCGASQSLLPPNQTQTCTARYFISLLDIDAKSVINTATACVLYKEKEYCSKPASTTVTFLCPGPPAGWVSYIVQPGDALSKISAAYDLKVTDLQRANCMGSSVDIFYGQKLYVPYLVTVKGQVFNDTNGDGDKDENETVISDFTVTLEDAAGNTIISTLTRSDGMYFFHNLLPGNYWVLRAPARYISRSERERNFGLVPYPKEK